MRMKLQILESKFEKEVYDWLKQNFPAPDYRLQTQAPINHQIVDFLLNSLPIEADGPSHSYHALGNQATNLQHIPTRQTDLSTALVGGYDKCVRISYRDWYDDAHQAAYQEALKAEIHAKLSAKPLLKSTPVPFKETRLEHLLLPAVEPVLSIAATASILGALQSFTDKKMYRQRFFQEISQRKWLLKQCNWNFSSLDPVPSTESPQSEMTFTEPDTDLLLYQAKKRR